MRKRRRVLLALLLCLSTFAAYGQQSRQSWQGNAAVARSGEFAAPGLYAASNAFPENTSILVQNAQTGESVRVTVTRRIRGTASIFLLLSEEAGREIGLSGSQVIRVQASVVGTPGADLSDSLREEAYSNDPDLNPPVSVAEQQLSSGPAEEEVAVTGEAVAEEAEEIAQAAEAEAPPPAEAEEPMAEEAVVEPEEQAEQAAGAEIAAEEQPEKQEPAEITEQPAAPPAAAPPTPEEKRLQELDDRIPQKQLYMPPRQQEVYALAPEPTPSEEVEEEIAAAEQTEEEVAEAEEESPAEEIAVAEEEPPTEEVPEQLPEEIEVEEEGPPRVSMLGPEAEQEPLEVALPGPEATEPEKPSPEGTRLPAPEEETPLTMAPEEPPTGEIEEAVVAEEVFEEPAAEVAMAEAAAEEAVELLEALPAQSYFVQLGAYSTRTLAEKLAGDLTQSYTVTILPASSGDRRFYKVLVGPLNVDESGTLLYQFRSRGFKDAFIQYVE